LRRQFVEIRLYTHERRSIAESLVWLVAICFPAVRRRVVSSNRRLSVTSNSTERADRAVFLLLSLVALSLCRSPDTVPRRVKFAVSESATRGDQLSCRWLLGTAP